MGAFEEQGQGGIVIQTVLAGMREKSGWFHRRRARAFPGRLPERPADRGHRCHRTVGAATDAGKHQGESRLPMAGDEGRQRGAYLLLGCQRLANGPGYRGIVFQVVGQGQRPIAIDRQDGDAWFIGVTEQGDLVKRREDSGAVPAAGRGAGCRWPSARLHGRVRSPGTDRWEWGYPAGAIRSPEPGRPCHCSGAVRRCPSPWLPGHASRLRRQNRENRHALCPPASRRAGAYATGAREQGRFRHGLSCPVTR